MSRGPMKWVDPRWNSEGEGSRLVMTDAEERKCRERNRLETCVVYTLNDVGSSSIALRKGSNLDRRGPIRTDPKSGVRGSPDPVRD